MSDEGYPATKEEIREIERRAHFWWGAYKNERTKNSDLQRHLRDRDAHIKNLEAQLMPYIGRDRDAGEQASLMEDA